MRPGYKLIAVLVTLLGMTLPAFAREAFDGISWTPSVIRVGAPCLFKVELSAVPSSVKGKWQGRDLVFFSTGQRHVWYGLAGVDVEATPGTDKLELEATMPDGDVVRSVQNVPVLQSSYKTEKLKVPERFVQPDPETLKRIEADKAAKQEAFSHQVPAPEWSGNFRAPVNATVSEGFGTRRTLNGKLARVHRGLDYHAPEGTLIRAANAGTVVLAQELFYEGNCVILDHGQQFMTLYMHLSKIDVAPGETVKQGQPIGLSGATGLVTGPHLHVAVRWQGAYLDPAQLWLLPLPKLNGPDVH
jgi:hypothetical protein